MITHKDAIAAHPISATTNASVLHYDSSAAQAVDQVRSDMSSQWQQSVAGSALPNTGRFHAGQETVLRGGDDPANGGSDPSKRGDNSAASLDSISSALDTLRNSVLNDLDPTKDHDPTKHGISDLMGGNLPSASDLFAQLGLPGNSNQTDPRDHSGSGSAGSHPGRPDGSGDNQTNPDTHHNALEGMLSADGQAGRDAVQKEIENGTFGKQIPDIVGGNSTTPAGQAAQDAKLDDDLASGRVDRVTHSNGGVTTDKYVDHNDKHVIKTVVTDTNNGTTTTLNADGSSTTTTTDSSGHTKTEKTPAPSIPDEDHQTAPVDPYFNKLMQEAIKSEHLPTHENDNKNIVDSDIPGTVSVSDVRQTAVTDLEGNLLTDNRNGGEGLSDIGHGGGGTPTPNPNQPTLDFGGPDYAPTPQSNGPEARTQPAVKTDPIGGAHGGQQGNGGNQSDGDSHAVSQIAQPIETTAQRLAHEVQDAYNSTHPDGSAKTAQSVDGVHTGHDIASVLGSTVTGHDNGAFADLIRLAQNPAQSGLVPPPVAAAHDAIVVLQLSALGDLAGHTGDVHHVDDVHAALALPAAVHEDISHVIAAATDHGHH